MRHLTLSLVAAVCLSSTASSALAQDGLAFPEAPGPPGAIDAFTEPTKSACLDAAMVLAENPSQDVAACFGDGAVLQWNAAKTEAEAFRKAVGEYVRLSRTNELDAACRTNSAEAVSLGTPTSDSLTRAKAESDAAKAAQDAAQAAADKARDVVAVEQAAFDAASKPPVGPALQAFTDRLLAAKDALRDAEYALKKAGEAAAAAQKAYEWATAALALERSNGMAKAKLAVETTRDRFHVALNTVYAGNRSPQGFEVFLENPSRAGACLGVMRRRYEAHGNWTEVAKKVQEWPIRASTSAHREDLMRKAQSVVSGAFSGNGLTEQPGSPDKAIFSVMSAVGADSRTNGSQLVMTLNLASLFTRDDAERLKLDSMWRNLVLRANLPLDATSADTPATSDDANAEAAPEVTRFSMVIGSSFLDDTDTRLEIHAQCYRAVMAYSPVGLSAESEAVKAEERKDYFDVCNRRAARSSRFSWRVGMGFYTPRGRDDAKTEAELAVGALVYAPTNFLYFNAFHQRVFEPSRVDNTGFGFSLAENIGGRDSGVNSWARVGIDVLGIYSEARASGGQEGDTLWEFRVTPTIRTKALSDGVATIAVGPRFFAENKKDPALLATFALTYDADALIHQTLVTPASPTQ